MVFKDFSVLGLWIKVASALEGLMLAMKLCVCIKRGPHLVGMRSAESPYDPG